MNYKKIIFTISLLFAFGLVFNSVSIVQARTPAELQALIQQLQAQIAALQQQIAQLQARPAEWCYDFNTNLRIGMRGEGVRNLHIALEREDFSINLDERNNQEFGESTASAVSGFQEKYRNEILTLLGLRHPTGFVGPSTRAKLNSLFGCRSVPVPVRPSITVFSPNGGERWELGRTYDITWRAVGDVGMVEIVLVDHRAGPREMTIATNVPAAIGRHSWRVDLGDFIWPGDNAFTISIRGRAVRDDSDRFFSVVAVGTDLKMRNITRGDFHPYGFHYEFCMYGPKSINDLKRENPRLTSLPVAYYVYDIHGRQYRGDASCVGGCENVKNGQCMKIGWIIQPSEQPFYNQTKRVSVVLDPDNLIVETNEQNNKASFSEPIPVISSITVLSPNGGERFMVGQTVNIKWSSTNIPATAEIKISLSYRHNDPTWRAGQVFHDFIVERTANTGSYLWTIPEFYARGVDPNSFSIRVEALNHSDVSNNIFTILASPIPLTNLVVTTPVLGHSYNLGDIAQVIWTPKNPNVDWMVSLLRKNDPLFLRLGIQGATMREWRVPVDISPGNDYYLRVNQKGREKTGYSQVFSIVRPPIVTPSLTVLSPNGGERWELGRTYDITWRATGDVGMVEISLLDHRVGPPVTVIARNIPAAIGRHSWTIPREIRPGDNAFTILIDGIAVGVGDNSDRFFSIVRPAVVPAPTITSISPSTGANNAWVTIHGRDLVDTIPTSISVEFLQDGRLVSSKDVSHVVVADGLSLRFQLPQIAAPLSPGTYQVFIINDNGRSNAVNFTVIEFLPDLIVSRFEIRRDIADINRVQRHYCFRNIGNVDSGHFFIRDQNLTNGQFFSEVGIRNIAPNEELCTMGGSLNVGSGGGGGHVRGENRIQIIVDSRNNVRETNEANNEKVIVFNPCDGFGDITRDGRITQEDADACFRCALRIKTVNCGWCDVNADRLVNIADTTLILRVVQRLDATFAICRP
jgi:hypothetical protein